MNYLFKGMILTLVLILLSLTIPVLFRIIFNLAYIITNHTQTLLQILLIFTTGGIVIYLIGKKKDN